MPRSPPAKPTITLPSTYRGAAVIEKFSCQRSAWIDQATLPVLRSSATSRPSSSPWNTLSSLSATPLLFQPQHTEVMFGSTFPAHCHRISPVSIDSANTSLAPVLT